MPACATAAQGAGEGRGQGARAGGARERAAGQLRPRDAAVGVAGAAQPARGSHEPTRRWERATRASRRRRSRAPCAQGGTDDRPVARRPGVGFAPRHLGRTWKHSQYFFRQLDFLQWQPLLCRTAGAPPPAAPRCAECVVVFAIFGRKAVGLRSRVASMAMRRTSSHAGLLQHPMQLHPSQYLRAQGRRRDERSSRDASSGGARC